MGTSSEVGGRGCSEPKPVGLPARIASFCQFLKPHAIVFIVVRNFHLVLIKYLLLLLPPPPPPPLLPLLLLLLLIFLFHKPSGYNYKMLNWKGHQSLSCASFHFAQEEQTKRGEVTWIS